MDSTTSIHRRIELQSSDDLNYLIANAKRAARARIDALYPLPTNQPSTDTANPSSAPRERGRDEHACEADGAEEEAILRERKKIEEEVDAYITQTFTYALPNLEINGLACATLPPNKTSDTPDKDEDIYEPYDPRLATRVQTLYATLEAETLALAQLRREGPARAAKEYREAFEREMKLLAEEGSVKEEEGRRTTDALSRERVGDGEEVNGDNGPLDLKTIEIERQDEVERTWNEGLEGLVRLKGALPGTAAKLERAKAAVEYVESR